MALRVSVLGRLNLRQCLNYAILPDHNHSAII
jgi:hypothetical protein